MEKLTGETFIKKAKEKYGNKFDYSKVKYVNNKIKVCIICPKHGEFFTTPNNFLSVSKYGCPNCANEHRHDNVRIKEKEFITRSKTLHNNKYDYSFVKYGKNNREKVCIICPTHGKFWQTPFGHLRGQGCPICRNEKISKAIKKDTEYFIEKSKLVHGDRYDYSKSKYEGTHTKITITCKKHGDFLQYPADHIRGVGCPKCRTSHLEESVENILIKNHIEYETQKKFEWLKNKQKMPLDFYLPSLNLGIECQGEQHFMPKKYWGGEKTFVKTKKSDILKQKLCKENGVNLEYILYNDNIENKVLEILKKYDKDKDF